jgi:hypothetical protein
VLSDRASSSGTRACRDNRVARRWTVERLRGVAEQLQHVAHVVQQENLIPGISTRFHDRQCGVVAVERLLKISKVLVRDAEVVQRNSLAIA